MIDGQGVVSHQRGRRSRGYSRPNAGRLPVICSLLCSTPKDRPSRNVTNYQRPNTKPQPQPETRGARPVTAHTGARCATPAAGGARPGLGRARSPGVRRPAGGGAGGASAVDSCDMPSSDAEQSPRIPCLYTVCHVPRFRHARTRLFPGKGWSKGTRAGRRSSVAGPVTHAAHIAGS
jgi:hypothetical protein